MVYCYNILTLWYADMLCRCSQGRGYRTLLLQFAWICNRAQPNDAHTPIIRPDTPHAHTHTMAWIRHAKPSVYSANLRWNRIWSSRISQFTSHRAQPKCSALAPAPIRTQTHSTNKCESRRMDRKLIDVEILELERLTWTKTTCCDVIDRHVMTSVKSTHSASDTVRSLHAVGSVRIHVSEP